MGLTDIRRSSTHVFGIGGAATTEWGLAVGPLSVDQVLAEEAAALGGPRPETRDGDLRQRATKQDAERRRIRKDADTRSGNDESPADVERRQTFYRSLNKLNRAALCLSGGGIRSATFCLGVVQAFAAYDVAKATPDRDEKYLKLPQNALLGRFQFLSTVSGGGYVGSWLSAWRHYDDFSKVWTDLTTRPDGQDVEPPELSWLRAYSNYLTPRTGLTSADAWTAVAIYLRNLLLNWLVIIPVLCVALLSLKFVAAISVGIARDQEDWWLLLVIGLIGAASLIVAQAFTTAHRPVRRERPESNLSTHDKQDPSPNNIDQAAFVKGDLAWRVLSAIAATIFFSSRLGTTWVVNSGGVPVLVTLAIAGAFLSAAGWIAGWPIRRSRRDFTFYVISGLVYGALVGLGAYLYSRLWPHSEPPSDHRLLLPIMFGIPWVLASQLAAEMVFVGFVSYENDSDSDREWLGRGAGLAAATAIVWAVTAFLSIAVGHYIIHENQVDGVVHHFGAYVAGLGGMSGVATAIIGGSSKTSATPDNDEPTRTGFILNLALAVAGPVFVATLIVAISIALDSLLIGDSLLHALNSQAIGHIVFWILLGGIVAAGVGVIASKNVNINRFSLHAVYRNRLVRCYLGAVRQARNPDRFTGFDGDDNPRVQDLWPPKATAAGPNTYGLFHVINIALNVVDSKRLAWQERKAEPFTVSALHCGSAYKGFRRTEDYGGPGGGVSLGTAMAISGAAVSPNMGYHSSPSITLLLALFNVRLGWWLGNPGPAGDKSYQTEGPSFAVKPLLQEAFGLTTDDKPYVYLSDGGHFDNLGLYEMVRRRCRFIVVIDAGDDPRFGFGDLGNALRKIYIDLGVSIQFDGLQSMRNRPSDPLTAEDRRKIPYCAIGVIEYGAADGEAEGCEDGTILYIKPALHGTEGAGISSYAVEHPTFPHETTTDQWFTESQFESYRSLGFAIANEILGKGGKIVVKKRRDGSGEEREITLREVLAALPETTRDGAAAIVMPLRHSE
jgi:hypothetical protein